MNIIGAHNWSDIMSLFKTIPRYITLLKYICACNHKDVDLFRQVYRVKSNIDL